MTREIVDSTQMVLHRGWSKNSLIQLVLKIATAYFLSVTTVAQLAFVWYRWRYTDLHRESKKESPLFLA